MPVEKFYSVKETCALLGNISRTTLWELRKSGELKFLRIGNRPVFAASQIEAYQRRLLGCLSAPAGHPVAAGATEQEAIH